jgi:hypothetical protein
MQTFLPYPDFAESALVLDRARLGKQRVETWQIVQSLTRQDYGWKNHPAVKMWRGHVPALALYGQAMCEEWLSRGYKDSLLNRFKEIADPKAALPTWIGTEDLHASHRANLLRKMPDWYARWGWTESPSLPYWWPIEPQTGR